ncbi:hypothetical protein [Micromonospora globbae]|uniref:Uncharacterized protein n=1 Tax=Micromonospora globbae TaxID=1894969 RepID=A0A420ETA1_9ACTN|nr:hypothetical protein [Micromonospora globbae]RKF23891.1 hypothetical protein D7I43_29260 [Micromonospora globbae]
MFSDRDENQEQQAAAFAAARDALRDHTIEIRTAGQLARLMDRLPADTPITVAGTTHIDQDLPTDYRPTRTITIARVAPVSDTPVNADDGDQLDDITAILPAVELGAVVVAGNALGVSVAAVPAPAYERAVEALAVGEPCIALEAQVRLLTWMAKSIGARRLDDLDGRDEVDGIQRWIDDPELLAALSVEAERLRQAAARLVALHARVADYEIAAEVTAVAEDIVHFAAERSMPDDEQPPSEA